MADLQPFENYALQEVIRNGWDQAESGVLIAELNGFEKKLFFQDGVVQFATSTDPDDKLPQVFIRQAKFTEEQYEAVLPNFKSDISVGRNLVEMGLITQQELIQGAKSQVYHIFETTLLAEAGKYSFNTDEEVDNVVNLPLKFPEDLFKGLLAMEAPNWLADQFGSLNFVPSRNDDRPINFKRVKVADFAPEVWELIDGEKDFNEIAFESDIDDRMLLKFIYALKLLRFITVTQEDEPEAAEEEEAPPETEEDDPIDRALLKDELGGAANHSDGIQGLADVPMDETVELSNMKDLMDAKEAHAQMEATTEISREVLKEAPPEMEEEAEEDDWNTPVSGALDEDLPDDDADEEAGLDDLGDDDQMDDMLQEELKKMEVPLEEDLSTELPEDDDAPSEEEGEAKPGLVARLKERVGGIVGNLKQVDWRKQWKLGILAVLFVGLAAATLLVDFESLLYGPKPEEQLTDDLAALDQATDNGAETAEDTTTPDDTEGVAKPAAEVEDPPETAETTDQPQGEDAPPTEQVVEDTTPEAETNEPVETVAQKEAPAETNDPLEQPSEQTEEAQPRNNPSLTFRSPIAEVWDPESGLPQGAKKPEPQTTTTVARRNETVEKPSVKPPQQQTQQRTQPQQAQAAQGQADATFIEPVKIDNNDAPISVEPSIDVETAADQANPNQLIQSNQLDEAAAAWRNQMQAKSASFTLALFLACQPQSVRDAYQKFDTTEGFFALPYDFKGRDCFWACVGTFDSYGEALNQLPALRERFPGVDISVKELNQIL